MTLEGASQRAHRPLWWYARHLNHQYTMVAYTNIDVQTACHIHILGSALVWKVLTEIIDNRQSYWHFIMTYSNYVVQATREIGLLRGYLGKKRCKNIVTFLHLTCFAQVSCESWFLIFIYSGIQQNWLYSASAKISGFIHLHLRSLRYIFFKCNQK